VSDNRQSRKQASTTCGLCLRLADLQVSHLLPAALYRSLAGPENRPIYVSSTVRLYSSRQIQAPQLCEDCEQRLHREGEDWFLRNCWRRGRRGTTFHARAALEAATPHSISSREGAIVYAAAQVPAIDVKQLSYFAASVFWKGTLPGWIDSAARPLTQLHLGRYAEELRLFLLGKGSFPQDIALLVFVNAWPAVMTAPYLAGHMERFRGYRFIAAGFAFNMLVGRGLSGAARRACLWHSPEHFIHVWQGADASIADGLSRQFAAGRPAGKLARERGARHQR
jgi:hypothetical protein